MKFLVDAQLPKALSELIKEKGYDCLHTSELPLKNLTPDSGIITISKNDKRIVITKDSDFYHSYILKKEPFKILFVRVGNLRSINLIALFNLNFENIIKKFKTGSIVEMTLDEIRILY